jgi:hypothetical protein
MGNGRGMLKWQMKTFQVYRRRRYQWVSEAKYLTELVNRIVLRCEHIERITTNTHPKSKQPGTPPPEILPYSICVSLHASTIDSCSLYYQIQSEYIEKIKESQRNLPDIVILPTLTNKIRYDRKRAVAIEYAKNTCQEKHKSTNRKRPEPLETK